VSRRVFWVICLCRNGRIHIHCFWFDIYTGEIWCFSRKDKTFVMINEETVKDLQVSPHRATGIW
jgi:hypothetical protein